MKKTKKFGMGGAMPAPTPMGIPTERIMDAINQRPPSGSPVTNREVRRAVRQDNNILRRGQGPMVKPPVTPMPMGPGRYDVNPPISGAGGVMPNPPNAGTPMVKPPITPMPVNPAPTSGGGGVLPNPPNAGTPMVKPMGMKKGGKITSKVRGHGCETRGKTKGRFV